MLRQAIQRAARRVTLAAICTAIGAGLAIQLVSAAPAHAFQTVQVGPKGATIFVKPKSDSATAGTLPAGATVNIGDQATNGYYRATIKQGLSGWIQEDSLILPHRSQEAKGEAISVPATPAAKSKQNVYVGFVGGLGIAGGGSSMTFGLDTGYKFVPEWGLGAYFTYLSLAPASSVGGAALMMLAAEINYYLPPVPELHVGAKGGLAFSTASATGLGSMTAPTGGAAIGYDYPVMPELALGFEGNVFGIGGNISSTIFNTLATVKYTF